MAGDGHFETGCPEGVGASRLLVAEIILDRMTEGVSLSTEDGVIVYTNAAEDRLFGYGPGELLGRHVSVLNAYPEPENHRRVAEVIDRLKAEGVWEGERRNRRKDGREFITASRITVVEMDGKPHWLCVQRDVTHARRMETELAASEERLRVATEGPGIGTYDTDLSTGEAIWSPKAFELLGLPPAPGGRGRYDIWRSCIHPDDLERVEAAHAEAAAATAPWRIEYRVVGSDGEPRWLETYGTFVRQADGGLRSIGIVADISDRRRADASVRESEELLQLLIDALPVFVSYIDHSGAYRLVNRIYEQWFGRPRADIVGRHVRDILGDEAYELRKPRFEAVLRGERQRFEAFTPRPDGTRRATELDYLPRFDADGRVLGFFALVTDVTERRETEQALQTSESRLRALLEAVSDAFYAIDAEWRFTLLNRAAENFFGMRREDILGRVVWDVLPAAKGTPVELHLRRAMEARVPMAFETQSTHNPDRHIAVRVAPKDGGGLAVSFTDITEHKQAEAALRASEADSRQAASLLEAIGASSPSLIYAKDRDCRTIYANPATLAVFGKKAEQVIGWTSAEAADRREEGAAHADDDQRVMETGQVEVMDEVLTTPDGVTRTYRSTKAPLRSVDGEVLGVVAVSTDVTDRLATEQALRESRERLDLAVEAHGIGIFDWDVKTGRVIWSEQEERLFGLEPGCFEGNIEGWSKRVLPEDAEAMNARMAEIMARGEHRLDFEFRILRPDGQLRYIEGSARFIYDAEGAPERMVGTNVDVTERKVAEQQLRESEARLVMAQRTARAVAWEWDLVANRIQWSDVQTIREIAGADLAEVVPYDDWVSRIHPEDAERHRAEGAAAVKAGGGRVVYRLVRNGEVRWSEAIGQVTELGADGKPLKMTGITLDITEQKRAEEALRAGEERLRIALATGRLGSWSWDAASDAVTLSDDAATIFGVSAQERTTWTEMQEKLLHPDDAPIAAAAVQRAITEGGDYAAEYRHRKPEGFAWIAARGRVTFDKKGQPTGMLGVVQDITDRRRWEEHQRLLINELNHRVKNTLAIVQGVAQQSFRTGTPVVEARAAFEGRLAALSAAHNVLTRQSWEHAQFREIVESAVAPFRRAGDERISVAGPDTRLQPKTAVALAMALHELATNAVKYGALSNEVGRVLLKWRISRTDSGPYLKLRWREEGGPPVQPPRGRGFGSRMIERGLAAELGGTVQIHFLAAGLCCEIEAPLANLALLDHKPALSGTSIVDK